MQSPASCPFGPALQKYWDLRYAFFSRFDEGIQIDETGLYSVKPEQAALRVADRLKGEVVLDAFGGVGGSAIGFARAGKRVICIELDEQRLAMAKHNAQVYGVADAIEFMHGDCLGLIPKLSFDAVNFDPPWGGPEYARMALFPLDGFSPDGALLIEAARAKHAAMAMCLPKNFDFNALRDLGVDFEISYERDGERILFATVYADFSEA